MCHNNIELHYILRKQILIGYVFVDDLIIGFEEHAEEQSIYIDSSPVMNIENYHLKRWHSSCVKLNNTVTENRQTITNV